VQLDSDLEFASIAGGGSDSWGFTWFGITTDGDLYAWGSNKYGKLGIQESQPIEQATPVLVGAACGCWEKVVANELHVLAIRSDGSLWSWGFGSAGQLGYTPDEFCPGSAGGEYQCSREPVQVDAGPWLDVAAGGRHSLGIKQDLTLWGWGNNTMGQLGTGDTSNRPTPTRIFDSTFPNSGDDTWRKVDAWGNMSLAVLDIGANDGGRTDTVRTWGSQSYTQYGSCQGGARMCQDTPYLQIAAISAQGAYCTMDAHCGDGLACMYSNQCWYVGTYLIKPCFLPAPNPPADDPITSISAGPMMSATWGRIETSGMPPDYGWLPLYSVSWGYNRFGETGRGPGGSNVCYEGATAFDCYRTLGEVVDDDTNPFLTIDGGRGIGAPQGGFEQTPPPILGVLNVWGINTSGQLGLGAGSPGSVTEPEEVPEFPLP